MSQVGLSQYVPTHEYANKTPMQSFDRRYVQLPLNDESQAGTMIPSRNDFEDGEFACPGFFDRIYLSLYVGVLGFEEWRYEMRREAQQVLPCLYLGPSICLKDHDFLCRERFTLFLSIRTNSPAQTRFVSGNKAAEYLGAEADSIDVQNNQELITVFSHAIRRINDHLASPSTVPKKVLVFCESGNDRSAIVVAAYLMVMFNMNAKSALYVVHQRRFCANVDPSLWDMLSAFESILVAKRDVEQSRRAALAYSGSGPALPPAAAPTKRTMDLDDEMEFDRTPIAPFQDR